MSHEINNEDELAEALIDFYGDGTDFYFLVEDANRWPHLIFESEDGEMYATTIPTEDDDVNASSTHHVSGLTYPLRAKFNS